MARSKPINKLPIEPNPQISGYTIYEDGVKTSIIKLETIINLIGGTGSTLYQMIINEIDDRISGDTMLYNQITGLTFQLSEEIINRISGDTELYNQITGLTYDLSQEIINRISGDTELNLTKFDKSGGTINGDVLITGSTRVEGNITGNTFIKFSGSSDQFLMADGSVITTGQTQKFYDERYVNVTGDTIDGNLIIEGNIKPSKILDINNFSGTTNQILLQTETGLTWNYINDTITFINEEPFGSIDGINKVFTTTYPFISTSLILFRNGIKEKYFNILSDTQIEINEPPLDHHYDDLIEVMYMRKF